MFWGKDIPNQRASTAAEKLEFGWAEVITTDFISCCTQSSKNVPEKDIPSLPGRRKNVLLFEWKYGDLKSEFKISVSIVLAVVEHSNDMCDSTLFSSGSIISVHLSQCLSSLSDSSRSSLSFFYLKFLQKLTIICENVAFAPFSVHLQ